MGSVTGSTVKPRASLGGPGTCRGPGASTWGQLGAAGLQALPGHPKVEAWGRLGPALTSLPGSGSLAPHPPGPREPWHALRSLLPTLPREVPLPSAPQTSEGPVGASSCLPLILRPSARSPGMEQVCGACLGPSTGARWAGDGSIKRKLLQLRTGSCSEGPGQGCWLPAPSPGSSGSGTEVSLEGLRGGQAALRGAQAKRSPGAPW